MSRIIKTVVFLCVLINVPYVYGKNLEYDVIDIEHRMNESVQLNDQMDNIEELEDPSETGEAVIDIHRGPASYDKFETQSPSRAVGDPWDPDLDPSSPESTDRPFPTE